MYNTFAKRFSALASGAYFTQKDKAHTGAKLYTLWFLNEVARPTDLGGYEAFDSDNNIRFNGEEMKAAFKALRNAGYHMFRIYEYGSWKGYICDKKPFYDGGTEVTTFNDFID